MTGQASAEASEGRDFEAAKREYEQSSHDEAARLRYVTKLADMRDQVMQNYWETHDKAAAIDEAAPIDEELRKHPMPRNVDSRQLSQLLVGKWQSPRHTYVFRPDGTYGMVHTDERDKWRIEGNEYIDDFTGGPIILLDRNYFIYACGQGVIIYVRANDSEAEPN